MAIAAEDSLGITEYLTRGPRISGVLKQRFRDFVVNEIDADGRVVQLTQPAISFFRPEEQKSTLELTLTPELSALTESALGAEGLRALESLETSVASGAFDAVVEIPCEDDKAKRTLVHKFIKEHFPALTSSTVSITQKSGSCIQAFLKDGINSRTKRRKLGLDNRDMDRGRPKFLQFVLWKRGLETMGAVKQIARGIGTKDKFFGVSGNKDKRAVTTQRISTFSNHCNSLAKADFGENLRIGDFEFRDTEVKMGSHSGNQFSITLRGLPSDVSEAMIAQRVADVSEHGFVNYFGLQRFGSAGECGTHRIGYYMLKQDYEQAVKLILGPRDTKGTYEAAARERFAATGDVSQALRDFRGHVFLTQYLETQLLEGMEKAGGDSAYLNGIMNLPRNSRMIYLHAYQSYIWNKVASARVRLGRTPRKR